MKAEAQRIAIAEACGITHEPCTCGVVRRDAKTKRHLADYHTDLNAIQEAVTSLAEPQRTIFMNVLAEIVGWHGNDISLEGYAAHTPELFLFCNATAAQRSEAFLRATGKWTE